MSRRGLALLGTAALIALAAGAAIVWHLPGKASDAEAEHSSPAPSESPDVLPSYQEDRPRALALARSACGVLDEFVGEVQSNVSAAASQSTLARFESTALEAYSHDVRWVQLLSSAKALQVALTDDNAEAARIGLQTASEECAAATARVPS